MLWSVLRDAYRLFSDKGGRFLAAAVAFYALLSSAPLLVVILFTVGRLFGRARTESALWDGLSLWVAPEGLAAIRGVTERLDGMSRSSGIIGALLVIYGSTRLFRALHRALNQLWGIDLESVERSRPAVKRYGRRYGTALLLVLLTAVLVVLLIIVKAGFALVAALGVRAPSGVLWALDALASVALSFSLFAVLFRVIPEKVVSFRQALTSAAVSTVLFALGSVLVTLYIRHKRMDDLYGGAAAMVIAVLWVYYSAQVFFLGACVGAAAEGRRTPLAPSAPG